MKKLFTILVIVMLMVPFVVAQEEVDPGVTPDSLFYGLDKAMDRISLALTFNKAAKAEKGLKIAEERLMEAKQMFEENKGDKAEKAQEQHERTLQIVEKAAAQVQNQEESEEIQNKIMSHYEKVVQVKTQILDRQRERMTEEQIAKLEEVFGNIIEKAQAMEEKGETKRNETGKNMDEEDEEDEEKGEKPEINESKKPEDAGEKGKGELKLLVSDAPADIGDFEYLIIEFSEARIFRANSSNHETFSLEGKSADLTELIDEKALEILTAELESGRYNKIELYVESVDAQVDNESVEVKVPSDNLKIVKAFDIVPDEETTFVFDINVVKKGQGGYNLLPVIAKSGVVGKDIDDDEVDEIDNEEDEVEEETMEVEIELDDVPSTASGMTEIEWEVESEMNLTSTSVYYGEMPHAGDLEDKSPSQTNYDYSSYIYAYVPEGEFNVSLNITENIYLRAHAYIDGVHYWSEQAFVVFG